MTTLLNGYGNWIVTWTLDGSTKILQTVHMCKNVDGTDPLDFDTLMRGYFVGAGRPYVATNMFVGYTLARTEAYVAAGGVTSYFLNETAVVGTKAGSNGTPINTSLLIKKNTGLVGRKYQGRHMIPNLGIAEADISQAGIITSGPLATYQALWTAVTTAMITANHWLPVLGHTSSEVIPTPITSLTVQPKIGTMRRRIRGF